ncbi:MAG: acyl carrier protein [Candidatus Omnitrophica bacterium]|nr:acyl carrier protein [Candidatus Omnitrophota bacterium]
MTQNTTQEILEIVSMILEKEPKEIPLDAHLIQDIGADSMMALEILAALEKKYRIVIPEDKLKEMTTLNKIISLVESARKKGK